MIRARKVKAVLTFEFLSAIKRKSYLIATFGMPVFMILYMGVIGFGIRDAGRKESETRVFGVVDHANVLGLGGDTAAPRPELPELARRALEMSGNKEAMDRALARENSVFRPYPDEKAALAALVADHVKGYYVIDPDYLKNGKVDGYLREGAPFDMRGGANHLGDLLVQHLLAGRVSDDVAELVKKPIKDGKNWAVTPEGKQRPRSDAADFARLIVPIVFALLMYISIAISAGYLLQAVATEKENKVVEVVLSSADPDEILAGKLLALGAAGLIQVAVWFAMAAAGGAMTITVLALVGVDVPWMSLGFGVVYFILGYLLIGSLLMGTASLGNSMRESQQFSMPLTFLMVIPLIMLNSFMAEPHGVKALVMTWIPFTAPLSVTLRLALEPRGVAWWELLGTILVLLASIYGAIKIGARLFRVGVLLTGSRPKFREIVRQAMLRPGGA